MQKSNNTIFFTTVEVTYCNGYIIKVISVVDLGKSDVTLIIIDHVNCCEKKKKEKC